ncbi:MAG: hypothetical protein R2822_20015 [Spirosomataceae bacterium]
MQNVKIPFQGFVATFLFITACQSNPEQTAPMTQDDYPKPPVAAKHPQTFTEHGYQRIDDYFWLKDKTNPETIAYLKAENAYADTVMAATKELQNTLFEEMKGRIKEDDQSVPSFDNGYYYYSRVEKGKQYSIVCRKKGNLEAAEEIIFDENKMAEGKAAFIMGGFEMSDDNHIAAYVSNTTGSYAEYELRFKDLRTGKDLPDVIARMGGSMAWAADNKTVFYAVPNEALRSHKIFKHVLGSTIKDELVYEEKDELFNCYVGRSKTKRIVAIASSSFTSSETRFIAADQPNASFKVFLPRQKDVEYNLTDHPNHLFVSWKDPQNKNRKIYQLPKIGYEDRSTWKEIVPHDANAKIEGTDIFEKYMVITKRVNGLLEINARIGLQAIPKPSNSPSQFIRHMQAIPRFYLY